MPEERERSVDFIRRNGDAWLELDDEEEEVKDEPGVLKEVTKEKLELLHSDPEKFWEGITVIGNGAFSGVNLNSLKSIKIPNTITEIGPNAFVNCNLTSIKIPNSVTKIGYNAFASCKDLISVELPEGLTILNSDLFANCSKLKSIKFPSGLKKIDDSAFINCMSLVEVDLPNGIEHIGRSSFGKCENLSSIKLPDNLINVSDSAFSGCGNLRQIKFPPKLKTIGHYAFDGCNIQTIEITSSIEKIGDNFCGNCEEIIVSPENKHYCSQDGALFDKNKTTLIAYPRMKESKEFVFPSTVKKIRPDTFLNCKKLESIILSENLENIGIGAFGGCGNLKELKIPDSVKVIGNSAFLNCSNLQELSIPSGVKFIENTTFKGCTKLESIKIAEGIKGIKESAFENCTNLKTINIPQSVKYISEKVFDNCRSLTSVDLPSGIAKLNRYLFRNCANLSEVNVFGAISEISTNAFINCENLRKISLKNGVKLIEENAFKECKNLNLIELNFGNRKINTKNLFDQNITFSDKEVVLNNQLYLIQSYIPVSFFYAINNIAKTQKISFKAYVDIVNKFGNNVSAVNLKDTITLGYNLGLFESSDKLITIRNNENKENVQPIQNVAHDIMFLMFKQGLNIHEMHIHFQNMKLDGINEEFVKFLQNKTNRQEIVDAERNNKGLTTSVYEWFNERKNLTNLTQDERNDSTSLLPTAESNRYKIKVYDTTEAGIDKLKWRVPTVELLLKEFRTRKFTGITNENRHIAEYLGEFPLYNQKHFDKAIEIDEERRESKVPDHILNVELYQDLDDSYRKYLAETDKINAEIIKQGGKILKNQSSSADKIFTYEMLAKSDVANLAYGFWASCCATLYGAGAGAQRAVIISPDMQLITIRNNKGESVCGGNIYVNKDKQYAVVNDFEVSKKYEGNEVALESIYNKVIEAINAFAKEYNHENPDKPLKIINCGTSPNWRAINDYIKRNGLADEVLKAPDFMDYAYAGSGHWNGDWHHTQYTIWAAEENESNLNKGEPNNE